MKKFIAIIFVVLLLMFPMSAIADDVNATFSWTQTDYDQVTYWVLYWGSATGGPYTVGNTQIDKSIIDPQQTAPVIIQYPPNAKTTYYYVLVAFHDADHFSSNSNETELEVDFILIPGAPVQLQVIITPG